METNPGCRRPVPAVCKIRCSNVRGLAGKEAVRQFGDGNRDVLMNDQSPHKWWSTLNFAVFG